MRHLSHMPKPATERLTRREREIMNAVFALENRASADDVRAKLTTPTHRSVAAAAQTLTGPVRKLTGSVAVSRFDGWRGCRDQSRGWPHVTAVGRMAAAGIHLVDDAGVGRAEPVVETARGRIRLHHPEINAFTWGDARQPFAGVAHQLAADASAVHARRHVQVVDVGPPLRTLTRECADESNQPGLILGDADELRWLRLLQTLVPHSLTIGERAAVEELVGHHSAVGPAPAVGMQMRDRVRIVRASVAEEDRWLKVGHDGNPNRSIVDLATVTIENHPAVRRRQLVELEDLAWCPRVVRDGGTDWLAFMANTSKVFDAVAPKIRAAMRATRTTEVLDLCSGGGGPWLTLQRELVKSGPVRVLLSDLYPNVDALEAMRARSGGQLEFIPTSVDAADVPRHLSGVRTMFNAFHHFPPAAARAILADAVAKRRAIAIFEGTNRRAVGLLAMPLQMPFILLGTPFVRPFRWSRLLFTYAVPLIPLIVFFDGTVSFLRLYLEDELRELVASIPGHEHFDWDIGSTRIGWLPVGLAHLVGTPKIGGPAPG